MEVLSSPKKAGPFFLGFWDVMHIRSIRVRGFRNIEDSEISPDPGLNFLVGANGQGKTSFIEAIGYLALLRSFRGGKSDEVLRQGALWGDVQAQVIPESIDSTIQLAVRFERGSEGRTRKLASVNGKSFRSSAQYLAQRFGEIEVGFHSIVFNPADHDLIRGEPAGRRAFIDRALAAERFSYLEAVHQYQRLLEQRNALLKQYQGNPPSHLLEGFTQPMGKAAAVLTYGRLEWLQKLQVLLPRYAAEISPSDPDLRIEYQSSWLSEKDAILPVMSRDSAGQHPLPSLELLERAFWHRIQSSKPLEQRSWVTSVGPHRDDWGLSLRGIPLKGFGSQGEVRSGLLALKLSEIELFRSATGHRPLLLLDDFSSELDSKRRRYLLEYLQRTDLQIFVTTTDDGVSAGRRFWVSEGKLSERHEHNDQHDHGEHGVLGR